jgi:hypothetical protein
MVWRQNRGVARPAGIVSQIDLAVLEKATPFGVGFA